MSFSLNEVEATAKRATRGAGYSWGTAEEAAKATRWLCAHGQDGAVALAELLNAGYGSAATDHAPQNLDEIWQCSGNLCALVTGACLSDCAQLLSDRPVQMRGVSVPMMILPFAASAARTLKASVSVECGDVVAVTDGSQLSITGPFPNEARELRISRGGVIADTQPIMTRARPNADAWRALNTFAHRTYAPATEESRLLGAGAGLSDND
ncbi:DUF3726 domain-containing protein [Aliiroseovarius sp. 2305UL8-7]|uniref:DUF3726 domain-containing protein n=1 Tax=Aliiroseovarius conchicola TaxID=3121637 RepID=UPI0035277F82